MSRLTELMHTPLMACSPGATLAMAAREMEDHNVGSLAVTDRDDQILGLITDRDIALAIGGSNAADTPMDRICTHSVVTIGTETDLHDAAALMARRVSGACRAPSTAAVRLAW